MVILIATPWFNGKMNTPPPQPSNPKFCSLFSCTQKGCGNPRIAPAVEHSHDKERFFFRGVGYQKIPHELKTQRPRSQIRTEVAKLREWQEGVNRFQDFRKDTVGGTWTVGSEVFPNFG